MKSCSVAVIILNWNGLNDTIECIESLQKASYQDLTIYVVDNASGNREAEILIQKYPAIKIIAETQNLGFCEGNNVGIRDAMEDGAEYVMLLNNDTLVPVDAIEKLVDEFRRIPDAGAISPVILEHPATDKVWFAQAKWDTSRAQFNLNPDNHNYDELKERNSWQSEFACGCCLLTSTTVLKKIGLLDERYFAYYDEADWCKRLERHGMKSYVTAKSFIYHKVSRTTPGLVSTYLLTRNRLLWMKENLPFRERLKSFSYLNKEFLWHILNSWGVVKGSYTKKHSKALLRGWMDYRLRRFSKWGQKTKKIIFPK